MSILIQTQDTFEEVEYLCEDIWELPVLIGELEKWLTDESKRSPIFGCIIDVGFDIRPDASGGGAVINANMMKIMAENNFELHLSEHQCAIKEKKK